MSSSVRGGWSVAVARWLVRRYPERLRSRFGTEIERALDEAAAGGWPLVWDAAWTLVRAWLDVLRAPRAGLGGGWRDLRHGAKTLAQQPIHTLVAVLTLGVAIGANAAVFDVGYSVLLRTLPYGEPERVVRVEPSPNTFRAGGGFGVSSTLTEVPEVEIAAAFTAHGVASLAGSAGANAVRITQVSPEFFRVLGAPPRLGPGFSTNGSGREAVLSHGLWQRAFGGESSVVGRTILLSGHAFEVVGVAAPEVAYPAGADAWLSYPMVSAFYGSATTAEVIARLTRADVASVALERHESLTRAAWQDRGESLPEEYRPRFVSLRDSLVGPVASALFVLFAASSLLLLLGCANVMGLSLVRYSARLPDLAVRHALGASRGHLARLVLVESVYIALISGVVAVALATWGRVLLTHLLPPELPGLARSTLSVQALGFVALASAIAGLLTGGLPAVHAAMGRYGSALGAAGRSGGGRRRLHPGLVVAQVAAAVVSAVGAGLLGRSLVELRSIPLGFDLDHTLTFEVRLSSTLENRDPTSAVRLAEAVRSRLAGRNDVTAVGYASELPLSPGLRWAPRVWAENQAAVSAVNPVLAYASDRFVSALGIPILAGLDFPQGSSAAGTVLISRRLALQLFGRANVVGERIHLSSSSEGNPDTRVITGVTGDVRLRGFEEEPHPTFYLPFAERPQRHIGFAIRTTRNPQRLEAAIRQIVAEVDPTIAPTRILTTKTAANDRIATRQALARVSATFASASLLLAILGIYGLMAHGVIRRRRELGIRLAIGARGTDLVHMTLLEALRLTLIGVGVGIVASLGATRLIAGLLWGVRPTDPLTYLTVVGVAIVSAILASLPTAWRVARVGPSEPLRSS